MGTLFISHSSRDSTAALALEARLAAAGHRSVFLDLDPDKGIVAGTSWERTLYTKLRSCRAVVALCTDNYFASQWCFAELALARMEGKAIFTLQAAPWSEATRLPSLLTEGQCVDLRADPEGGYERLWRGLKAAGITPAEHREWSPNDPPYPGLRAFEETDAPLFFGREHQVVEGIELLNRVRRQGHPRFVLVLGASGSGKSSLARAGLVPQLRQDRGAWIVVGPFRPGREPAQELADALAEASSRLGSPERPDALLARLAPPPTGGGSGPRAIPSPTAAPHEDSIREQLRGALRAFGQALAPADEAVAEAVRRLQVLLERFPADGAACATGQTPSEEANPLVGIAGALRARRRPANPSVLLVVDQFEELLGPATRGQDHPSNRFLELLRGALEGEDSPLVVLATMRSDYLETFQKCASLRGLSFHSLSLGPMSRGDMRAVIAEPARLGQIELEVDLAERLLDDTGTSDALPLLAFTLRVMWDRCRQDRLFELREYQELGGLQGAIARVAEETLATALRHGREDEVRDAFLSLARPSEDGATWVRRAASLDSFPASVRPLLQLFVEQRLLIRREDGATEVAHEALFRSWDRLGRWLDQDREFLLWRKRLGQARSEWDRLQRDGSLLLAGPALAEGRLWLERKGPQLEANESGFLRESLHAATRRRRRQVAALALLGAMLIATATGGLALWRRAERQRTLAEQRRAENQDTLGKTLLRPVGLGKGPYVRKALEPQEIDALWEIAALGPEDLRVRELVLANSLAHEQPAIQLHRRIDPTMHALMGLSERNRQALGVVARSAITHPTAGSVETLLTAVEAGLAVRGFDAETGGVAARRIVAEIERLAAGFVPEDDLVLSRLGRALSSLGAWLPDAQAREGSLALAKLIGAAVPRGFGPSAARIGIALGSLGTRVPPEAAWEAVAALLPAFEDPNGLLASTEDDILRALGRLGAALSREQNRLLARGVAEHIRYGEANLRDFLEKPEDERGALPARLALLVAMGRERDPDALVDVARLMFAYAEDPPPGDTTERLMALLQRMEQSEKYRDLRPYLAARIRRLPATSGEEDGEAEDTDEDAPDAGADPGGDTQSLVRLLRLGTNVPLEALEASLASWVDGRIAGDRSIANQIDAEARMNSLCTVAQVAGFGSRIPEMLLPGLVDLAIETDAQCDEHKPIGAVLTALEPRLSAQACADALKHPLCTPAARSVLLRMIEGKTGREFQDDPWQLVAQAKELGLDVESPPRRPTRARATRPHPPVPVTPAR